MADQILVSIHEHRRGLKAIKILELLEDSGVQAWKGYEKAVKEGNSFSDRESIIHDAAIEIIPKYSDLYDSAKVRKVLRRCVEEIRALSE